MIDDIGSLSFKHEPPQESITSVVMGITEAAVEYVCFIALSHCVDLLSLTWQIIHSALWIFCAINHRNIVFYYLLSVDPHL